jgi:phosphatidylethanolamine/phosphatidyl-N-methylethanolamine N-methyltransferase
MNTSNPPRKPDLQATANTQARYQRIAPVYDLMEAFTERRYFDWRHRLWGMVRGNSILEVGVGTGKNMPFYPEGIKVTGIDLTPGMLDRAHGLLQELGLQDRVTLQLGDAQAMDFPDASFDMAIATFVFCSVPDPIQGLHEMKRVVKPGGTVLLLEHMRSPNPFIGSLMDVLNPLIVRMMGANINRHTVENVQKAGLELDKVVDLQMGGIFKFIVAHTPTIGK